MLAHRNIDLAVAIIRDGRPKYVIAAACPMPPGTLSAILGGRLKPSPIQRERLAEVLGLDALELFGDES